MHQLKIEGGDHRQQAIWQSIRGDRYLTMNKLAKRSPRCSANLAAGNRTGSRGGMR